MTSRRSLTVSSTDDWTLAMLTCQVKLQNYLSLASSSGLFLWGFKGHHTQELLACGGEPGDEANLSQQFIVERGVRQGSVLSQSLFLLLIVIDSLLQALSDAIL